MEEFCKQIYEEMSAEQKEELLTAVNLSAELSVEELAAYVGVLPMTQSVFNSIAQACITLKDYNALFKLFQKNRLMGKKFMKELGDHCSDESGS